MQSSVMSAYVCSFGPDHVPSNLISCLNKHEQAVFQAPESVMAGDESGLVCHVRDEMILTESNLQKCPVHASNHGALNKLTVPGPK